MGNRVERVNVMIVHLQEQIAVELDKMEHDLDLYSERTLTSTEFLARIEDGEQWIIHFVRIIDSLQMKIDQEEEDD